MARVALSAVRTPGVNRQLHREHPILVGLVLYLVDVACITAAFLLTVWLLTPDTTEPARYAAQHLPYLVVTILVWVAVASDQRIFARTRRSDTLVPQLCAVTNAVFVAIVFTVFLLALFLAAGVDGPFMWAFAAAIFATLLACRLLVRLSIWDLRRRGYNYRQVILVGSNESTLHLAEVFLSHGHYGYHVMGFLDDDPGRAKAMERSTVPYLGPLEMLEQMLSRHVVDGVYITLPLRSHYETVRKIANLCEGVGVPVRLVADLFPQRISSQEVVRLESIPLITLAGEASVQPQRMVQRLAELVVSAVLLIVLSPVLLFCAILVKLDSRGPVLVTRECIGRGQRSFRMFYFRCTRCDATTEATAAEDAALTRMGRFFRRYSFDELPQLLNVCFGQMSTVGPRPISLADFEVEAQRWRRAPANKA